MPTAADFDSLIQKVAERYAGKSIIGARFASGKLSGDPVYRQVLELLPSGQTLIDVGCGQGLMLALLVEAGTPRFDRLVGIETRANVARLARAALGDQAEIVQADGRNVELTNCSAVLLFDVLQMMPAEAQQKLMVRLSEKLVPGGIILVREAHASSAWGFRVVRIVNRIKSILVGSWRQRFHFRSREGWLELFGRVGLEAEEVSREHPNRLGNLLFVVRRM